MTARWAMQPDVDPCGIPIGRGQHCTKPGDHLDGCDWPLPRCLCSHGPGTHTGGHGRCWSLSCACGEYRDPPEDPALAQSIANHPAGKAIPPAREGRIVNAVPLPDFEPGSSEWMKRMTASKVAAVLGLSPWESRFSLWHRMAGLIESQPDTDQTRRGHYLEPAIAQWFSDQHPEFEVYRSPAFAHPERDWQAASPDRLIGERFVRDGKSGSATVAALEVKTTAESDEWGAAGTDEIPPYYRAQVVWQLDTLGLSTAYVAVLLPRLEFREYRIEYNAAEAAYIRAEARAFLDSLPGGPAEQRPDLDAHSETYAAVKALHPDIDPIDSEVPVDLAREFCDATNGLKAAKAREALARTQLADHMGSAKRAVFIDGDTVTKLADRRAKGDGIPYVQAAAKLPEIGAVA